MCVVRKILCVCVMAAVLVMAFPVSSLAVDPVSAATMANAFAQAITAYGAQQGVSMMFDISNTSQIGEQVHELWKRFRSNQQTADDYETIAATVFPSLYYKAQRAAGAVVGIKLAAEYIADLDGFWNYILSGPAEMQKVDDAYVWELNQDNTVTPISVYSADPWQSQPPAFIQSPSASSQTWESSSPLTAEWRYYASDNDRSIYAFFVTGESKIYFSSPQSNAYYRLIYKNTTSGNISLMDSYGTKINQLDNNTSLYYKVYSGSFGNDSYICPVYDTLSNGLQNLSDALNGLATFGGLSVRPYIGDTAPQDVYIPDNEDVNYVPIPADIPLDIPWDDSLYGDGQILTDAQSIDIADALDLAISDIETLELADTASPPAPSPNEVYIPLLPVELPSFNFSLSGIWHYVVSWVQSLGAWLSLMFQTWAVLPSAITIPVYATAVIVIVLGVYKRFFM